MFEIKPEVRTWIYRVGLAVIALSVVYGIVDDGQAATWVGLLAAFLSSGVASVYAPTKKAQEANAEAAVEEVIAKIHTGEITADSAGFVPGEAFDVYPETQLVEDPSDCDAPHGVNPELIEQGDIR